jgi:hypothetical protein
MQRSLHPLRTVLFLSLFLPAACGAPASRLFLDVHHVGPGKVTCAGVADAHAHDLAAESAHGVEYQRYWVDEGSGTIYCLVRAPNAAAAAAVHRQAHGLVADEIHEVTSGILPEAPSGSKPLFMDTHQVEPGTTAAQVAEAHRKDLAAQGAHGVRFLEYWVDETTGRVHCLAEAPDADALVATHRDAHGLLPSSVVKVVAGK